MTTGLLTVKPPVCIAEEYSWLIRPGKVCTLARTVNVLLDSFNGGRKKVRPWSKIYASGATSISLLFKEEVPFLIKE